MDISKPNWPNLNSPNLNLPNLNWQSNDASPQHGGNLGDAIERFGGKPEQWLDLSTGISPWNYPIPTMSDELWRQLPKPTHKLEQLAANYYNTSAERICISPGSQLAIRLLPSLVEKQTIAIPFIGYQEHHFAWMKSGHTIKIYRDAHELKQLVKNGIVDSAVVINPNNPTNEIIRSSDLDSLAHTLSGLLIVDEAFADVNESESMTSKADNNIIVMRSIGKFFGLAGARIGFLIGEHSVVGSLKSLFTPWSINSPADFIVQAALNDQQWQQQQSKRITQQSTELAALLNNFSNRHDLALECRTSGLFISLFGGHSAIESVHLFFAQQQLWTRIGEPFTLDDQNGTQQNWLRLSLPGIHLDRLKAVLNKFTKTHSSELTSP